MMEASGRANEIVGSIRELFKTTAHQMTPIEINRLVQQVLRMVENDLHVQGVTVSTEFQEDLPQITGDRTLLQQVILNLVKNAIEAMAAGPTTIKALRLVTTQDGNSVVSLSVQDSGPGITPENGTHVFDPFFTTKSSGTGLGLSISRKIIEDHGGDLRLTKTGSNGCTFEITLPSVATNGKGPRQHVGRADEVIEQRLILLRCMSPLLAQSRHRLVYCTWWLCLAAFRAMIVVMPRDGAKGLVQS